MLDAVPVAIGQGAMEGFRYEQPARERHRQTGTFRYMCAIVRSPSLPWLGLLIAAERAVADEGSLGSAIDDGSLGSAINDDDVKWSPPPRQLVTGTGTPWPALPFWPIFLPQGVMFVLALWLFGKNEKLRSSLKNVARTLILCLSAATPMSDTTSDMLVAYSFFNVGDYWWFGFSIGNLIVAGLAAVCTVNGWAGLERTVKIPRKRSKRDDRPLALAQRMAGGGDVAAPTTNEAISRPPHHHRASHHRARTVVSPSGGGEMVAPRWLPQSVCIKSTLAFLGLGPVVETLALVACWIQANGGDQAYAYAEEDAARTKVVELIGETGPQVMLQTFVAVSYGLIEPDSPLFSKTFVFSMVVSSVTAAWAFTSQKKAHDFKADLLEILFVYIWRFGEVVSRAFSLALLGCAFGGAGYMMLALCAEGIVFLGLSLSVKGNGTGYTTLVFSIVLNALDNTQSDRAKRIAAITAPIWLSLNSLFFLGAGPHAMSDMDTRFDHGRENIGIAARYYLARALSLASYYYIFWNTNHAPNNFGDKFLPVPDICEWNHSRKPPSPPCYSCFNRELAMQLCTYGTVVMYLGLLATITRANFRGDEHACTQRGTFSFEDGALRRWKPGDTWCVENIYVQLASRGIRVGRVHTVHRDQSGAQTYFVSVMWQSASKRNKKPRFEPHVHMRTLVQVPAANVSSSVAKACSSEAYEALLRSQNHEPEPELPAVPDSEEAAAPALEDGWQAVIDPASGQTYYENAELGQTTWDPPYKANPALVEPELPAAPAAEGERQPVIDTTSGVKLDVAEDPAPAEAPVPDLEDGWQAAIDPANGLTYYENLELGKTTWDPPCKANKPSEMID